MSVNNRLSRPAEEDWRLSLTEPSEPDDLDEPSTPIDVPNLGASDVEFLDDLCDRGRR
jgi:hypothetical protein